MKSLQDIDIPVDASQEELELIAQLKKSEPLINVNDTIQEIWH